jgi:beta-glucuronidase
MVYFLNILRNAFVLFACYAVTLTLLAQQPLKTLLVGIDHRSVLSLNGDWHYLVDQPPAKGLYTAEGKVRDNGYALNAHPNINSGPHNEEYDFDRTHAQSTGRLEHAGISSS